MEKRFAVKSGELRVYVLLSALARRRLRLVFSRVLLVSLGLHPALWEDLLLGPVRRRTQQGLDVIVVDHLML